MSLGHPLLVALTQSLFLTGEPHTGLYQSNHITNLNSASYWAGRCLALYSASLIIRRSWNHPEGLFTPVAGFSSSLDSDDEESCLFRFDMPVASTVETDATASSVVANALGASLTMRDIFDMN